MGSRHFWIDGPAFEKAANEVERKQAIDEARHIAESNKHALNKALREYYVQRLHRIRTAKPTHALRQALREQFGKRNYKITRNGDVHVYGPMPKSRIVGWWLMGDILNAELWLGLHKCD